MRINKFIPTLTFVLFLPVSAFCQDKNIYKKILRESKIGKIYQTNTKYENTSRTFMGMLKDENNKNMYYVIKEYKLIPTVSAKEPFLMCIFSV